MSSNGSLNVQKQVTAANAMRSKSLQSAAGDISAMLSAEIFTVATEQPAAAFIHHHPLVHVLPKCSTLTVVSQDVTESCFGYTHQSALPSSEQHGDVVLLFSCSSPPEARTLVGINPICETQEL